MFISPLLSSVVLGVTQHSLNKNEKLILGIFHNVDMEFSIGNTNTTQLTDKDRMMIRAGLFSLCQCCQRNIFIPMVTSMYVI